MVTLSHDPSVSLLPLGFPVVSALFLWAHLLMNKQYIVAASSSSVWELSGALLGLLMLFLSLGITSLDFLCPNLQYMAQMMRISKKLAGMTLLALGNSAPDLFSTYVSMKSGLYTLALGELVGSALLCLCVVVGLMGVIQPFHVAQDGNSRKEIFVDLVFFGTFVGISLYFIQDGKLVLVECALMIVLYIVYITVQVWTSTGNDIEIVVQPFLEPDHLPVFVTRPSILKVPSLNDVWKRPSSEESLLHDDGAFVSSINPQRPLYLDILAPAIRSRSSESLPVLNSQNESEISSYGSSQDEQPNDEPVSIFELVFPFTTTLEADQGYETTKKSWFHKILAKYLVLANSVPFAVILVTTPCSSIQPELLTSAFCEAHRKLLVIQVLLTPILVGSSIFGVPGPIGSCLVTVVSIGLAISSYLHLWKLDITLKNLSRLRIFCAILGFVNLILWILIFLSAVVRLLEFTGQVCHISHSLLGLTLFAIGNLVGDMVSNVAFANLGLAMTGLGACFGSPLLYILVGVGVNGCLVIAQHAWEEGVPMTQTALLFEVSHSLVFSGAGLMCMVVFYIISIPLNGWKIDRKIGTAALGWWVCVTLYNVLYEVSM